MNEVEEAFRHYFLVPRLPRAPLASPLGRRRLARPREGRTASPSWLGREDEVPVVRRLEDMDFGERI